MVLGIASRSEKNKIYQSCSLLVELHHHEHTACWSLTRHTDASYVNIASDSESNSLPERGKYCYARHP